MDTAEKKAQEKAFKESAERMRLLLESTEDLIFLQDLTSKYTYFNKEKLVRSFPESMIGKKPGELFESETADAIMRLFNHVVATKEVFETVQKITWKGEVKWFLSHGSPILDSSGAITAVATFAKNITGHKIIEEKLTRNQRLESIESLAGGIAHNFNSILSSIIGYTEVSLYENINETVRQNLMEVMEAAKRAQNLIDQILSFSKSSKQEFQTYRLGPIIKDILKFLRSVLPSTIRIDTIYKTEDDRLITDPNQIRHLLVNLCTNAAHAMEEDGGVLKIILEDDLVNASDFGMDMKSVLKLTVKDTGKGIDPVIMDKIFDPFFTTKQPGEQTGLGLWVVYGIMKSHGGSINIKSEPGQGTEFELVFPKSEEKKAQKVSNVGSNILVQGHGERVLCVDDEPGVAKLVGSMLKILGYDSCTVASSGEALDIFKSRSDHFDVVITDHVMPELTGIELVKEILKIRPEMKIILCSGYHEVLETDKVNDLGLKVFLKKPLTIEKLSTAMQKVNVVNKKPI
ncbi:MAG: Sensor histidine kinase RcsC [Syntrophus sp. SKADARSKE-3]|nr:Sensor histidine kinase RcsC [Syntrophus sp. SKADARSKE-3]